jgi:hypothetical protein
MREPGEREGYTNLNKKLIVAVLGIRHFEAMCCKVFILMLHLL